MALSAGRMAKTCLCIFQLFKRVDLRVCKKAKQWSSALPKARRAGKPKTSGQFRLKSREGRVESESPLSRRTNRRQRRDHTGDMEGTELLDSLGRYAIEVFFKWREDTIRRQEEEMLECPRQC
jgi:hypothetical protein